MKMKRIKPMKQLSVWSFAALLCSALLFASCDDDAVVASYLSGTWEGTVFSEVDYGGQVYQITRSEVEFTSGYTSGTGYWVDYYGRGYGRRYTANHIRWHVENQSIYIHFIEENSDVVIDDYRLTDDWLTGYASTSSGNRVRIRLYHTSSPNWNDYDYGYTSYYGYAKSRNAEGAVPVQRKYIR